MVHPQLKFSCVLPLKFMCTYAVRILVYSAVKSLFQQLHFITVVLYEIFHLFRHTLDNFSQIVFHCVNKEFQMSLLSSRYVAHALDKCQTRESAFHISKTAFLNKCWQVSSGKIKLHINELRFLRSCSKPSILLFQSRTRCTHSESLFYTMERNLRRIMEFYT